MAGGSKQLDPVTGYKILKTSTGEAYRSMDDVCCCIPTPCLCPTSESCLANCPSSFVFLATGDASCFGAYAGVVASFVLGTPQTMTGGACTWSITYTDVEYGEETYEISFGLECQNNGDLSGAKWVASLAVQQLSSGGGPLVTFDWAVPLFGVYCQCPPTTTYPPYDLGFGGGTCPGITVAIS